jgi:SAM-dependent methyltransferase
MAAQLTGYFDQSAEYDGFDISAEAIDWCKRNITPKHPNFHFQLADIYNGKYNPEGKFKASNWKFPYDDESFDLAIAKSVFTHMLTDDMRNYLHEIQRVLKQGGRCLVTFFLLNPESFELVEAGKGTLDLRYAINEYRTVDPNIPEDIVAYPQDYVLRSLSQSGLRVELVRYGWWCGRPTFYLESYQDLIVASKG